jgi:hypothetical protein
MVNCMQPNEFVYLLLNFKMKKRYGHKFFLLGVKCFIMAKNLGFNFFPDFKSWTTVYIHYMFIPSLQFNSIKTLLFVV